MKKSIKVYDTTMRDGSQAADITFSLEDKIRIAQALDELGIHYLECGWPGSNPRDMRFFKEAGKLKFKNAEIVAFGSTRRKGVSPGRDPQISELLAAGTKVVTIVGKTWKLHGRRVLGVSAKENLAMIGESIDFLKQKGRRVFFDAEHFFDGYRSDPVYALEVMRTAEEAGADLVCACDTNGGAMPLEVAAALREVRKNISIPLGIHTHNDCELAVANSMVAVQEGAVQVQGTINGFGERCGNADLCALIPNLMLKEGYSVIGRNKLKHLRDVSRLVYELANKPPDTHQAYVGDNAFAHKGGQHADAVIKDPRTYEHITPDTVGNRRKILVSDLSGKSNIAYKANEYGINLDKASPETKEILSEVKRLEDQGYQFEGAEASFELLMRKAIRGRRAYFRFKGFRVIDEKRAEDEVPRVEATIMVEVSGKVEHTAAEGVGPVNALDNALRKALERFYPSLKDVRLIDYKVRVLPAGRGTASQVRVLIESTDGRERWGTVGVSDNIIEASWQALTDSVDYKLYKDEKKRPGKK
jgi:2-isopropylmalate synthase